MPEAFGRLNMSHPHMPTQADRMVRELEAWFAANAERIVLTDFAPSDLHRQIRRVVYGAEFGIELDGEFIIVDRKAVLEGLPCGSGPPSSSSS